MASARATSSVSSGRGTPTSCREAPAGFVNGPSRLNAVRTPSSLRAGAACRIEGGDGEAGFGKAPFDGGRRRRDVHAERFEEVRAAAPAGPRAVPVLRYPDAARRQYQGGNRRDVEGVCAVTPRPARVEHGVIFPG